MHAGTSNYVMGHEADELRRLELQGRYLEPVTRALFERAGITQGQAVLDFGCGAGDVSFLLAELVGPQGRVVAIDRSAEALGTARARAAQRGLTNIEFVQADESQVGSAALPERSFDAVAGRLVLMYQRDAEATLRQLARAVKPGGAAAFQEFNLGSGGASAPRLPLFHLAWDWATRAAEATSLELHMGVKLPGLLRAAGLVDVEAEWMGRLVSSRDPVTFELAAAIVRGLLPVITRHGVATAEEVGIDTLAARMHAEGVELDGTVSYATSVGVWARKPA